MHPLREEGALGARLDWISARGVDTKAAAGCATSPFASSRRFGARPMHDRGCVRLAATGSSGLPSARSDVEGRPPAGDRVAPQSRSRRPASQRTSPDSEPSVEGIYRLIDGRDRGARVHRGDSLLTLSDFSQAAVLFFWHAARRRYPRRPHPPSDACAPFGKALDDPCEGSGPPRRGGLGRVADEPGGERPKPFASLSLPLALTTTP